MRYHALACDYDGTLALHGRVDDATLAALKRLRESGRKLALVTGRVLDDLARVFSRLDLFDHVVAENGAVLYRPATREHRLLGEPPPGELVEALRGHRVEPLSVGKVIVATWEPHETTVLEVIHALGLERQVIFNKGAVMVLPSGVNKATGLAAALKELGLSPHNAVGVGDAENDHAFLNLCECSVAVANALPAVQDRVDLVTEHDYGAGVAELIDRLLASDLQELESALARHEILLGMREDGQEVRVKPHGVSMLLAGTSGGGKSTLATGFLERLAERGYQFCIIDPEGDYQDMPDTALLGDSKRAPTVEEVLRLLDNPDHNCVINLLGTALDHRPAFFMGLLPALLKQRAHTGRPHWILIDEAHHLLPASREAGLLNIPADLGGLMLVTVHPEHVAGAILSSVDLVLAIGESPGETLAGFSRALGQAPPLGPSSPLQPGEAIAWWRRQEIEPFKFRSIPARAEHDRHVRKYAEGELGPDRSFYFRGPEGKLNLRAQNLMLFLQLAEGVDDRTWLYHLRRGDYSRWFREAIKDDELAAEAQSIERTAGISAEESRALIKERIESRYTIPA